MAKGLASCVPWRGGRHVVKSLMNSSTYLVLEQDGAVVGFARYLTDGQLTTFVSELVVAESYR